ncbi:hypothetical protein C0J52_14577 [Blattella germanica]|nr:hypothetical protein C0J52_14577 [Blattella germanica]
MAYSESKLANVLFSAELAKRLQVLVVVFRDCFPVEPSSLTKDAELKKKLWEESVRLVGLGDWDPFTAQDTETLPPAQKS